MFRLTIKQANEQLQSGKITSTDLVKAHFERIKKIDSDIKAYVLLLEERALAQALEIDKKGDFSNPLTGIPYAMKDMICMEGIRTTACSKMLENFIPPYSATVAKKLDNAVCLGKANCDEFAMGSSTENSAFFPTKNPWDLSRVPGGSSGGSAASVASDEAIFAIGTDTGGSIRQPAAFCGCVGLKVTYGRVSRSGVIAYASSFDTIGPVTKTVEDAAIVLNQIAGQDPKDSTTPNVPVEDYTLNLSKSLKGKKVAYIKEFMNAEGFDPRIKKQTEDTLKTLETLGCEIGEASIPGLKYAIETYYLLVMSEASSNLSRYDGIKYGNTTKNAKNLKEVYMKSRSEGFGPEPKRKIMLGTFILSAGYIDAYYKKAMKARNLIKQGFDKVFEQYDAVIAPVTPGTAFEIGKHTSNPLQMYLEDIFTGPINIAGIPGLSIPVGFIDGLPVGVQILGKHFAESEILNIGNVLEKEIQFKRELY